MKNVDFILNRDAIKTKIEELKDKLPYIDKFDQKPEEAFMRPFKEFFTLSCVMLNGYNLESCRGCACFNDGNNCNKYIVDYITENYKND